MAAASFLGHLQTNEETAMTLDYIITLRKAINLKVLSLTELAKYTFRLNLIKFYLFQNICNKMLVKV